MPTAEDLRIRSLRPRKPAVDPWRPIDHLVESELDRQGRASRALTIFLAGAECPFTCVFCDLWRFTTDAPTPEGAIPAQIQAVLADLAEPAPPTIKLYNASNFFDSRAVPAADDPRILDLVAPFERVVVECHPRLVGQRCLDFGRALAERGSRLEVAMGFETIHPQALPRLGKKLDVHHLRDACERLSDAEIDLRAFVLLGAPYVPLAEELHWLRETVRFALHQGASPVCLIPVRGDGAPTPAAQPSRRESGPRSELARLAESGHFHEPGLDRIEAGFEACLALDPRAVQLDTWDLERFATDSADDRARIERLRRRQTEPTPEAPTPESPPSEATAAGPGPGR